VCEQQLRYRDRSVCIGGKERRKPAVENARPGDAAGACSRVRSSAVLMHEMLTDEQGCGGSVDVRWTGQYLHLAIVVNSDACGAYSC
jgi:hypothetical protein